MKKRALSRTFFENFMNKGTTFNKLLETVKNDDDLALFLRGDNVMIYYKSMKILEVDKKEKYYVDERYNIDLKNCSDDWKKYFSNAKQAINEYNKIKGQEQLEKEVQQLIVRENNNTRLANATDYYIIDIEYTQKSKDDVKNGRFDCLAVYWSKKQRKNGANLQLAFIEVKAGIDAITGHSGVSEHCKDVVNFVTNITESNKEAFLEDIEEMIAQLREMGLWKFNSYKNDKDEIKTNKNEIKLNREEFKPQLIFALANHDNESAKLHTELEEIKKINFEAIDLRFATASFLGYGLYEENMLNFEDFISLYEKCR